MKRPSCFQEYFHYKCFAPPCFLYEYSEKKDPRTSSGSSVREQFLPPFLVVGETQGYLQEEICQLWRCSGKFPHHCVKGQEPYCLCYQEQIKGRKGKDVGRSVVLFR